MKAGERLVIVGGGPGGLAAARAYRAAGGRAQVALLCGEDELPYRRPPLTKTYLRGEESRAALALEAPAWYAANAVEVHRGLRATALDLDAGAVSIEDGTRLPFDACVLATGSEPRRPPFAGAGELPTLRTLGDADRIRSLVGGRGTATVVGAGFIGCEAAASLALTGTRVTLVAPGEAPHIDRLGEAAARRIEGWLEASGVRLRLGTQVEGVERQNGAWAVRTAAGETLVADLVLLATGVRPRTELAEGAGLAPAEGAVQADSSMRTSHPAVLVAGDIAAAHNDAAGRRLRVEHWGDAREHGRIAGETLAGREARWDRPPGFWSTIGERTLKHTSIGDGFDEALVEIDERDRLVVRYRRGGATVGLLAHGDDEAYAAAREELRG